MLRIDDQAFRTDTGRQRNANEDSFFVRPPIFVVADGMGGAQAGEVASKAAAEAFDRDLPARLPRSGSCGRRSRRPTARSTSTPAPTPPWPGWGRRSPRRSSTPRPRRSRSATSATAAPTACARGKLERLTRDHSLVEEMRRKGQLTEAQAEDHPQRSIITRALGPEPEVEVDVQTVPAQSGRRLPALLRRADDDARRRADRAPAGRRDLDGRRRCARWSTKPTGPGAATTSPRSPSGSRTPPRRRRAARGRDADRPDAPRRRA